MLMAEPKNWFVLISGLILTCTKLPNYPMKKTAILLGFLSVILALPAHAQSFPDPCINGGLELTSPGTYTTANAVSGWTISSQTVTSCNTSTVWTPGSNEFAILSTPISTFGTIGMIPNSPLGGTNIAMLNNTTPNGSSTKLSQKFKITYSCSKFIFAYA